MDQLRYLVRGGLVALSRGRSPWDDPAEYARQFALERNAVRLAEEFARAGFSSVIEGLGDDCRPHTPWIKRSFAGLPVRALALVCSEDALHARLRERGWDARLLVMADEELAWYLHNARFFEQVIDTTGTSPDEAAARMLRALWP